MGCSSAPKQADPAEDEPGQRFQNAHERWKGSNKSRVLDIVIVISGVLLIAIGAALSLIPGIPGIILGIPGLALIATRSRRLALWMDWTELKCRKLVQKLCRGTALQ